VGVGTPGVSGTRGSAPAPAGPLSGRARVVLVVCATGMGLALGAVGTWTLVDPGHYSHSADGCVSLTVPNSTGGAVLHACGDQARHMCRSAFAGDDRIAVLVRPQCRSAGLGPAAVTDRR
jgi:hypothetical protein